MLFFQAGYYGINRIDAKQKIDSLLKRLGLDKKKNSKLRQLSGGMKRRFQIAKALVHDPDILILDEPTAGVDVELRHELWNYLRELHNNGHCYEVLSNSSIIHVLVPHLLQLLVHQGLKYLDHVLELLQFGNVSSSLLRVV